MTNAKRVLFIGGPAARGELPAALGLGLALERAGHRVTFAVTPRGATAVRAAGLRAAVVGEDFAPGPPTYFDTVVENLIDVHRGPLRWLEQHVLPAAPRWIAACLPLAREADLLIGGPLDPFLPTLSELAGVPWVQVALSPYAYLSAYDPPELARLPLRRALDVLTPAGYARLHGALLRSLERAAGPLRAARKAHGLPPGPRLFERDARHSPFLNVAAFSPHFSLPKPDWPAPLAQIGFVRYDGKGSLADHPALLRFLEAGPKPVLLTLGGSAAVWRPGAIYDAFAECARRMPGLRGVVLVDPRAVETLRPRFPDNVCVAGFVPYGELLPRCRAVIHHGAAGAVGRALQAGVPSLVIGHAEDHRDNGRLLAMSGAGLCLRPSQVHPAALEAALHALCTDATLARDAAIMADKLREEHAERAFVKVVELLYGSRQRAHDRPPEAARA